MTEKLQQAIDLVKTGDKSAAQRLLSEVLKTDPNNEQAWLWLSAVVSEDKKRYCIEKVLSINPDNQQAQRALQAMQASSAQPTPTDQPSAAAGAQPEASPSSDEAAASVQNYWLTPDGDILQVIALRRDDLVSTVAKANNADQVEAALKEGFFPAHLLGRGESVALKAITEITQLENTVKLQYRGEKSVQALRLDCANKKMAAEVMKTLHRRLTPTRDRKQQEEGQMSKGAKTALIFLAFIVISAITYWFSLQAFKVVGGDLAPTGEPARDAYIQLLDFLGPLGVLIVGGVTLLGLWLWMLAIYRSGEGARRVRVRR